MPTMEMCYMREILEALESAAAWLCYRVSEEGASPQIVPPSQLGLALQS